MFLVHTFMQQFKKSFLLITIQNRFDIKNVGYHYPLNVIVNTN